MINLNAITRDVVVLRRKAAKDFATFRKYYFQHYHKIPDSLMHTELSRLLSDAVKQRGSRLAIAAPRGFAKSTLVSLEFVIYCICYGLENFIVILSSTHPQAATFLRNIKLELETNERLRNDFPEVCGVSKKSASQRWSENEIITGNDVKVIARSTGQQVRGLRHGAFRPSLIILDDIDTAEVARNQESLYNLESWLTTDIFKAGDKNTNVAFIGTIHHPNSLLGKYTDSKQIPGWQGHIYKAITSFAEETQRWDTWSNIYSLRDSYKGEFGQEAAKAFYSDHKDAMLKGAKLLWPDRYSYYDLMVIREQEGAYSFDSEYQNEPINPRDCSFEANSTIRYNGEYSSADELLQRRGSNLMIVGAADFAMGKDKESGDYSAIVIVAIDCVTDIIYVLDVDVVRRTPDKTLADILSYYPIRKFSDFAVETNLFQSLLADELERRKNDLGYCFRLKRINNTQNKQVRIETLQPLFKSGKLRILSQHLALIEEMRFYPKGAHDDALDALELAVRLAYEVSRGSRSIMKRYR